MNNYEKMAETFLRILGTEDLLFPHHGEVFARPEAYKRLGELMQEAIESDDTLPQGLTWKTLRSTNVARCEDVFHQVSEWSLTDWGCAMAGEAGEACNVVKKLRRLDGADKAKDKERRGALMAQLAEEIADTIIYCDLLAARAGINLGKAVIAKFNKVSIERGSKIFL